MFKLTYSNKCAVSRKIREYFMVHAFSNGLWCETNQMKLNFEHLLIIFRSYLEY